MMTFTYLASPYHSPDPAMMQQRYEAVRDATAFLLKDRVWVYSPIVHCHEIAKTYDMPKDFEFWRDYNFAMLEQAHYLAVLLISGWKESKGVQAEIEHAKALGMNICGLERGRSPGTRGGSATLFVLGALPCHG